MISGCGVDSSISSSSTHSTTPAQPAPKEKTKTEYEKKTELENAVTEKTKKCEDVETGFCNYSSTKIADFRIKSISKPAEPAKPAVPAVTRDVVDYCTLCNDGTYSPSCATGRGACSHHGGVAQWNAKRTHTVTERSAQPAVPAKPAQYDYKVAKIEDSPDYKAEYKKIYGD
ncbi:hypothetical protein FACS1894125_7060 [Actinomycetota bacterium]|nr:hypothetical protein FACS1894125_7060 [Actinomycetota bacterium]